MLRYWLTLLLFSLLICQTRAQLVINEASNRNYRQITDEDGEYNDWIELYNASDQNIDLNGWSLSDSRSNPEKWNFAPSPVNGHDFVLVHASGKNRNHLTESLSWGSVILPGDEFKYIIPGSGTSANWYKSDFNDSGWETGKSGFGYGDGDDETKVPEGTTALFLRKTFHVEDVSKIIEGQLFVDYDDGFVAFLNGVEIARSNVSGNPQWNTTAANNHEATGYSGGLPEKFDIDPEEIREVLKNGENVLAIAAINVGNSSSDFSMIPTLLFGAEEGTDLFGELPEWYAQSAPGNLHTNFKLRGEGERIFLSKGGVIVDSLDVDGFQRDMSIGRITDGAAEFGIFTKATPGASNNSSEAYTNGFTSKPKFSLPGGFYNSGIEVAASVGDSDAVIHYTIDGSEPTESSPVYSTMIKVTATRCIRLRAFNPNRLPSKVSTATYFVREEEYTLPVLSVIANRDDIFGNQGIFTRWQDDFEIPAHMEYFDKNKKLVLNQDAGMQIDGGAGGSRSLPQHSFRMEPGNGTLGDGDVNYKLLHRRPNRTNYPSFYVRNGSNQHLTLPYKDGLEVTALGRNTYTYYSAYEPIVVYINGEFYGVYELREKINDDYLVDNYQMNIDSLDFLGVSYFKGQQLEALRGSIDPFIEDYEHFTRMDPDDADYLEDVGEFLDIKCYTDYIIAESWVGNNDWPQNNIKLFRCASTGYRWQWAINDLEWALNPNGWTSSSFDHIQYMMSQGTWNYYTRFWYLMMNNPEYKAYFVNRFADLMNTSYDFSVIGPLENEMFKEINAEMDHEYERWGGGNVSSRMTTFMNNHNTFRSELSKRSGFVRAHLQSHFNLHRQVSVTLDVEPKGAGSIQISTITPDNYPWEGIYFGSVEVKVQAIPNPGYEFVNWDDDKFISDVSQEVVTGVFNSTSAKLKANFRESNAEGSGVVISEINYKSGSDRTLPDWLELCNLSDEPVNLKGWSFTDSDTIHRFTFWSDLSLGSQERIVISNDIDLFNQAYPGVNVYSEEFGFGLGSPTDKISLYNVNKDLVLDVRYSDNYPWALSDDQAGRTLELRSPGGDYNEASSWFRGCIGGSPGTSYQFCDEQVVSAPVLSQNPSMNMNVYPNPVYEYMTVEFDLDTDVNDCFIKIYNTLGSEILFKDLGEINAGSHHLMLDLKGIERQLLLVKLVANGHEKLEKILKAE